MGLSTAERRERILSLLRTVEHYAGQGGANYSSLVSLAVREFGVSRATAKEYVAVLEDARWVRLEVGGALFVTNDGLKAIDKPPKLGTGKDLDADDGRQLQLIRKLDAPPSPPSSPPGVGEPENARHPEVRQAQDGN